MCFVVERKNSSKKIAKRNIGCYKIVKGDYTNSVSSLYYNFKYSFNFTYNTSFGFDLDSYLGCDTKKQEIKYKYINEGFHSYTMKACADYLKPAHTSWKKFVKCIIPKGATYFYNSINGEYVSDKIIIKEFVKTKLK